jgi:hypothetical protein
VEANLTMPWATRSDDEVVGVGQHVRVGGVGTVMVIFVAGMPVRRFERNDQVSLRLELAHLEAIGVVTQAQVARSGLVSEATFHRDCADLRRRDEAEVRARMGRGSKGPRKLVPAVVREIGRLRGQGLTLTAIGTKLGMSEKSVRNAVAAMKPDAGKVAEVPLTPQEPVITERPTTGEETVATGADGRAETPRESTETRGAGHRDVATEPAVEAPSSTSSSSGDDAAEVAAVGVEIERQQPVPCGALEGSEVAAQRATEFTLARMGMIQEQSALFPPTGTVRYAGVMLAMAMLPVTGLLDAVKEKLGQLANGLYGVRAIVTTLVAMALLRCKRPEQLKGFDPAALGAVVGLARAPEMKTLRRKVAGLASDEGAVVALVREMARRHVDRVRDAVAFLYVDGHVRPYFGKTRLGKTHDAVTHAVLPATTDYWLSDAKGAPVLVVVTEGNGAMTTTMPQLLDEARRAVGPDIEPTVVFDRGGYSPKLFKLIRARNFHLITYRKGKHPEIQRRDFATIMVRRGGSEHPTLVCDKRVRIKGYGLMRCVAVLRSDGRQTHVLTTRTPEQLPTREVLERMFSRWQQENFFKYLEESFAFDALWTYDVIDGDPSRTVPNPDRAFYDRRIKELGRELTQCMAAKERAPHAARITVLEQRIATCRELRDVLDKRAPIGEVREREGHDVLELARAPKLLGDVIKMTAFHIESMLLTAMAPHLARARDEGRAVIADFMQLDGRLEPQSDHLLVTLHPASAPRYTHALEALCENVNALEQCFPGTNTRLRFRVAPPPT